MRSVPTRLDSLSFGPAASAIPPLLFTLCALAGALAPGVTTAYASYMIRLDLTGLV
jgi:hypothetical protein